MYIIKRQGVSGSISVVLNYGAKSGSLIYLIKNWKNVFSCFVEKFFWPMLLKGQCHEIFCFWFFYESVSPPAPEYPIRTVSNFFETSRRYSQVKVHHRCRWHPWQIMRTISGCRHLKVNLKANIYIYVNSTTKRCPNKIIKIFLLEDFFHLPPVSLTQVVLLEPRISPRIFEKIWNGRNGILICLGETDSWKKPEVENLVTLSL